MPDNSCKMVARADRPHFEGLLSDLSVIMNWSHPVYRDCVFLCAQIGVRATSTWAARSRYVDNTSPKWLKWHLPSYVSSLPMSKVRPSIQQINSWCHSLIQRACLRCCGSITIFWLYIRRWQQKVDWGKKKKTTLHPCIIYRSMSIFLNITREKRQLRLVFMRIDF